MRVLLVTGSFPPMKCGVGDYSCNLAKALILDSEVYVGVLTSTKVGEMGNFEGIEIFPVMKSWNIFETFKVMKIIRQWLPDIVHIQYPTQGYGTGKLPWALPMICFLLNKKVVQTWHGGYGNGIRDLLKFLLKIIIPGPLVVVYLRYEKIFHPHFHWALRKKMPVFIPNSSSIPRVDLSGEEKNVLKNQYLKNQERLVVFFGFVYPYKGVEFLFEIADPVSDQIVIAGEIDGKGDYAHKIIKFASAEPWIGKVTITGFLPAVDVGALLAVADAVILPFRSGGGDWNTSLLGAVLNGAFVITTSLTQNGYDPKRNVYFAKVDNVKEMKAALSTYAGIRRKYAADIDNDGWSEIAAVHCSLYENFLSK